MLGFGLRTSYLVVSVTKNLKSFQFPFFFFNKKKRFLKKQCERFISIKSTFSCLPRYPISIFYYKKSELKVGKIQSNFLYGVHGTIIVMVGLVESLKKYTLFSMVVDCLHKQKERTWYYGFIGP